MTTTRLKKRISEEAMVNAFLASGHFKSAKLYTEVPVFSRCVDLVVLNGKKQVIAIEFKKEKWKEAIEQALRVSTGFDFLEICILKPQHEELQEEIISICRESGIGVYFMNPKNMKVKKVLQSKRNASVWKVQKKDIKKYLERRNNQ